MPTLKTPLIYLLAALLLVALGVAGYGRVQLGRERTATAEARRVLAEERADRARSDDERSRAALRFVEKSAADNAAHAVAQQEISHALTTQTTLRLDAAARARDADARMRDQAAALRAALDRLDAAAAGPAGERAGDRPDTLASLLADGGQLLAQSGEVVAACWDRISQRDAEVAALKAILENDRRPAP